MRCSSSVDSLLRTKRKPWGKGGSCDLPRGGQRELPAAAAATCEAEAKHPEKCYKSQFGRNNNTHVLE
jgi:hypothetical protein